MQEGLGRLFNVVPAASGVLISVKDTAGISFVITGAAGTLASAATEAGATAALDAQNYYTNTTVDGSAQWVDAAAASPASPTVTPPTDGAAVVYVDAADLPAGSAYVSCTAATGGAVTAIVHDLDVQRDPARLRVLSGASS